MGRRRCGLSVALAVLCFFALLSAASAAASEKHVYDPILSLSGACGSVSSEDGVEDPGCPTRHPPNGFLAPCGAAVDSHGDIYVASRAGEGLFNGRIDVFDAQGRFLTEIADEEISAGHHTMSQPCDLTVDREGNVYSRNYERQEVYLFEPAAYPPQLGEAYEASLIYDPFEHGNPASKPCLSAESVAIDPTNGHLYVGHVCRIEEYGSAAEGSPLLNETYVAAPAGYGLHEIGVYGKNHDIYASARPFEPGGGRVFVFDGVDQHVKCQVDGAEAPEKGFSFGLRAAIGVDQANGDFYVEDTEHQVVDQFAVAGEACEYVGQLPRPPKPEWGALGLADIAVDDPIDAGEAGYDSPNAGNVYFTSGINSTQSHLFAFKPRTVGPPQVSEQEVVTVGEDEAVVRAELNPGGLAATYHFEYTTQASFDERGYEGAASVPVPDGVVGGGTSTTLVSATLTGLEPGTAYRFRLAASNCSAAEADPQACLTLGEGNPGGAGADVGFLTFPGAPIASPCPNESLRTDASSRLPDCRAYELVTPPDTNGWTPTMTMLGRNYGANGFATPLATPDGESVLFGSNFGALPGVGGGGFMDTFEARRDPLQGWQSQFTGLSGSQAEQPKPGGSSADHGYAFWYTESAAGSIAEFGYQLLHVPAGLEPSPNCTPAAEPGGRFEWVGCGSLAFDPYAEGKWLSPGGGHVVFETGKTAAPPSTPVRLEPCAPVSTPSEPVRAIYDRTSGGPTRCVSVPPASAPAEVEAAFESESPQYLGTSADGSAVAFELGGTMYVGGGDGQTFEAASGKTAFGGLSADGSRAFYLAEPSLGAIPHGELYACEIDAGPCAGPGAHEPIQIGSGGESTLVNVSADGSHVYFVSPQQLDAAAKGIATAENLYVWDGATIGLVAVLDPLDVSGVHSDASGTTVGGLGQWTGPGISAVGSAIDPSRSSPNGEAFVFESRAEITGYDSGGHREVYRYMAGGGEAGGLACLSCNSTGAAASDARLQSDFSVQFQTSSLPPVNELARIENVTADGAKVFFQSGDRLVAGDLDGRVDVYEWEVQGSGGCQRPKGCLALLSDGRSAGDDYLYATAANGHDIFFLSGDMLVGRDGSATPSIYDAREGGGIAEPPPPPGACLSQETCLPPPSSPEAATPATAGGKPGNGTPRRPCRRRGKAGARSSAKRSRCAKRHHRRGASSPGRHHGRRAAR
jgi:hypothetical protein